MTLKYTGPLAVCGLVLLAIGCGAGAGGGGGAAHHLAPAVEAVPARVGSLPLEELVSGVARARNQVAIRPEISGIVAEVLVRNGDEVRAGQALARLDTRSLDDQLRRAEAELRVADATANEARARVDELRGRVVRSRALAAEGFISDLELETLEAQLLAVSASAAQAEARVDEARAALAERRSALAKATIVAPVSGVVGQRDAELGMVVSPSTVLFVVGDPGDLIVEFPLTQEMLERVSVGMPVQISTRGGEPLEAAISRISPFLEASSFSTTAEVDLRAPGRLRPGMFVSVRVLYGASATATLVPASALWEDPASGDWSVFVITDSAGLVEAETASDEIPETARSVELRFVTTLAEGRGRVALANLDEGEWVVTLGQHLLHELSSTGEASELRARVRPTSWQRLLELQGLQREDLLAGFMAKQRQVARVFGAELPESPEQVDELLARDAAGKDGGER